MEMPAGSRESCELFLRKDAKGQESFFFRTRREGQNGGPAPDKLTQMSDFFRNGNKGTSSTQFVTRDGRTLEDFAATMGRDPTGRLLQEACTDTSHIARTPDRPLQQSRFADSPSDVSTASTVNSAVSPWDGNSTESKVRRLEDHSNKKFALSMGASNASEHGHRICEESSHFNVDNQSPVRKWPTRMEGESQQELKPAFAKDVQPIAGAQKWGRDKDSSEMDVDIISSTDEWRREGSEYIGRHILRYLLDDNGRPNGKVLGKIVGWLPAEESDYFSQVTGKAEPLWHVELEDDAGEEDLEPFELHEALDMYEAAQEGAVVHGEQILREYTTEGHSSIPEVAKIMGVDATALRTINSLRFPGLRKNSKLQPKTSLLVPPVGVTDEDTLLRLAKENAGDEASPPAGKKKSGPKKAAPNSRTDTDTDKPANLKTKNSSPKPRPGDAGAKPSAVSDKPKSSSAKVREPNSAKAKSGKEKGAGLGAKGQHTKVDFEAATPPPESPKVKKPRKPKSGMSPCSPLPSSAPPKRSSACRFPDFPLMCEADFPPLWHSVRDRMVQAFVCPYEMIDGIVYGVRGHGYEAIAPIVAKVEDKWAVSLACCLRLCQSKTACTMRICRRGVIRVQGWCTKERNSSGGMYIFIHASTET
jgi:hypothetical protein